MKKQPKVSVVVPIYNVEKFLHQAVDSILAQTLQDIEIILVDDGSPDNCGKICDEYAKKDKRVKVIHKENHGLGAAYNTGLEAATGEYIGLVEPDDWIEPEMYEVMYHNAKYYDTDATKCGFWEYNSLNPSLNRKSRGAPGIVCHEPAGAFKIEDYEELCAYHSSIWSYIYKSSFVKKIKFVEARGAAYVDAPFAFEVLCKAKRLSMVDKFFYHWRVENHGNSVSLTDKRILAMADRFIESKAILKHAGKYETLKEIFYLHAKNANYKHYQNVDFKFKYEYFKKLRELFADLKNDETFQYKYIDNRGRKWIKNIYNNHFMRASFSFQTVRRFLIDLKIKKNSFLFQILGFQISKNQFAHRPALIKWQIKSEVVKTVARGLSYEACENRNKTDNPKILPAFASNNITVCLATDENYINYLGVTIQSIMDNAKAENNYDINILYEEMPFIQQQKILKLKKTGNFSIRFICLKEYYDHLSDIFFTRGHFTKAVYHRFFISEIFKNYPKVLYLDCDLVVNKDIADLFATQLESKYLLAACHDYEILYHLKSPKTSGNTYVTEVLNLKNAFNYFQSGVLLFNIKQFQKENILEKLLSQLKEMKSPKFVDQDVLNIVCEGRVLYLDAKWNVEYHIPFKRTDWKENVPEAYVKSRENPWIVHYSSSWKPWRDAALEMSEYFWQYARKTPFYEEIFYDNLKNPKNNELLRDIMNYSKLRFNYYRCALLANFAGGGNLKEHYVEKKKKLKEKIKRVEEFLKGK